MTIVPFWGVLEATGYARLLFLMTVMIRSLAFARSSSAMGAGIWIFPWALVTPYINIFIIIKATLTTLKNRGIDWRGTHYSLAQLRKNRPIL